MMRLVHNDNFGFTYKKLGTMIGMSGFTYKKLGTMIGMSVHSLTDGRYTCYKNRYSILLYLHASVVSSLQLAGSYSSSF